MGEQVNAVIDNICEKLGYAASEITPEMARCMIAKDVATITASAVVVIVCIILFVALRKSYKVAIDKDPYEGGVPQFIGMATVVIVSFVFLVIAYGTVIELTGWLTSPKASMFQYVLKMVK